jgi:DMSO/TMAO reductase YedYZ heme-binding membrane subunit
MVFLISLVAVCIVIAVFHQPLTDHPGIFYAIALLMVGLFLYAHTFSVPAWLWRYFLIAVQRSAIALSFFMIVMFIPALPADSKLSLTLYGLRRQLAILGSIFAIGHIAIYSLTFVPRLFTTHMTIDLSLALSLVIALILVVLLILLTVTSFSVVRKMIRPDIWKRIQSLAYPFFLLLYIHLLLVLGEPLLAGNFNAIVSISIYTVYFVAYCILTTRRLMKRRHVLGEALR